MVRRDELRVILGQIWDAGLALVDGTGIVPLTSIAVGAEGASVVLTPGRALSGTVRLRGGRDYLAPPPGTATGRRVITPTAMNTRAARCSRSGTAPPTRAPSGALPTRWRTGARASICGCRISGRVPESASIREGRGVANSTCNPLNVGARFAIVVSKQTLIKSTYCGGFGALVGLTKPRQKPSRAGSDEPHWR